MLKARYVILSILFVFILGSCKKDNDTKELTNSQKLVADIVEKVAAADSISIFISLFKDIKLSDEDVKDGITVLAPHNDIFTNSFSSINNEATISESPVIRIPDNILKTFIIKGTYSLADLTHGRKFYNLNNEELVVNITTQGIFIEDLLVSGKEVYKGVNSSVFCMKDNSIKIIGPDGNITESGLIHLLKGLDTEISSWQKELALLDGVLSNDAPRDSVSSTIRNSYSDFFSFSYTSSNNIISQIWSKGYNLILKLNTYQDYIKSNFVNKDKIQAEISAKRAYVYLQLLSYYGNIVFVEKMNLSSPPSNTNRQKILDFISTELHRSISTLSRLNLNVSEFNVNIARGIEAKFRLLNKDYAKVKELTQDIIDSKKYSLATNNRYGANSTELIWNDLNNYSSVIKTYFYSRETLPYLRLSEIHLMNAEANLALGDVSNAEIALNPLMVRHGVSGQVNMALLQTIWLKEMRREGSSFVSLVRWDLAYDKLNQFGFKTPKNNLLPIPRSELSLNQNLVQNIGYVN